MERSDRDGGAGDGVDSRQLVLVACCLFGLITAAFLAPVTGENEPIGIGGDGGPTGFLADVLEFLFDNSDDGDNSDGSDGDGGPLPDWLTDIFNGGESDDSGEDGDGGDGDSGGGESGDGDGGGSPIPDWLRDLFGGGGEDGGGGEPARGNGEPSACQVYVGSDPTPGSNATVLVTVDSEPAGGVRVWFNDDYVGRTNEEGTVTGEVPYVSQLNVTVESPVDEPCAFSRRPGIGAADTSGSTASIEPAGRAVVGSGAAGARAAGARLTQPARSIAGAGGIAQQSGQGRNNSTALEVSGEADIRLEGDPYPGATVTLIAAVDGVPMADATVSVDGEAVGQTDGNGRYELTVPDRDRAGVTVSRGEISGEATVDVLQLQVTFARQLVVPGETAALNVTRNGAPVGDAAVTLDGRQLGTTGSDGRLAFRVPVQVDGTVEAATDRQSASVPLVYVYGLTIASTLVLAVFSSATTWLTARRRDRSAARRVAAWWAGVWTLFAGYAIGELPGLAVAGLLVALAGLYRYRRAVRSGGATAAEQIAAFLDWCRRGALWIVGGLETAVDWLTLQAGRLAAWLRSMPRSLSALAGRFRQWLVGTADGLAVRIRSLTRRQLGAVALSIAFVAVAGYELGAPGVLLSGGLVAVTALGWWLRSRETASSTAATSSETSVSEPLGSTVDTDDPTLRQLWRRLASWVVPGSWRTRTPAEVSRAAVEQGLPREPVEALTDAFRDVEYGGQPESSKTAQAWAAWEALESRRGGEEDER